MRRRSGACVEIEQRADIRLVSSRYWVPFIDEAEEEAFLHSLGGRFRERQETDWRCAEGEAVDPFEAVCEEG